jgi:hypothetical protein
MFKLTGTLESVDAIVIRKDSQNREYRTRTFLLNISSNPSYPNYAQFQLEGDKCTILNQLKQGNTIEVGFGIKGRKYTKQSGDPSFFQTLVAMSIATISREYVNAPAPGTETNATPQTNESTGEATSNAGGGNEDDLPF